MQHRKTTLQGRFLSGISTGLAILGAVLLPYSGQAAGTVTNLNWLDLDAALSGGGTVTLACDGTLYKQYTDPVVISANTVIDATGHQVTLNGWSGWGGQMFSVASGVTLTLSNVTIANCSATANGPAINNSGTVNAFRCVFSNNVAQGSTGIDGAAGADSTSGNGGSGTAGTAGGNVYGGAIYSSGTFAATECQFVDNAAWGGFGGYGGRGGNAPSNKTAGNGANGGAGGRAQGGAIFSTNSIALTNCYFYGNTAMGGWGGNGGSGGVGSGVGNNGVGGIGGPGLGAGLFAYRSSVVIGSTYYLQDAIGGFGGDNGSTAGAANTTGPKGGNGFGGGIYNAGTNITVNCTFSLNSANGGNGGSGGAGTTGGTGGAGGVGSGGGIYGTNAVSLTNCTVAWCNGNGGFGGAGGLPSGSAGASGAAMGANIARTNGTFTLKNSIFAGGSGVGGNGNGTFVDAGYNISDDSSITLNGTGSHSSTDPMVALYPASNGGLTPTLAVQSGSPAINAADNSAAPKYDQRGFMRIGTADIGSFECGSGALQVFASGQWASLDGAVGLFLISGLPSGAPTPFTVNFTLSGTASNGVDYVQVTNSVVIPTGLDYARVLVRGIPGAFSGTSKSVVLTLASGTNYMITPNDPLNPDSATVTLYEHDTFDSANRYVRGSSTAPDFQSIVIPLDYQTGVPLDPIGGNATNFFAANPWTNTLYHFDATNLAPQVNTAGRVPFGNPIVAFGERFGGSSLYLNQPYEFGIFGGDPYSSYATAIRIKVYAHSNSAELAAVSIPIPDVFDSSEFPGIVNESFTTTTVLTNYGLATVLSDHPFSRWGHLIPGGVILRHTAISPVATNFFFVVEDSGYGVNGGESPLAINGSNNVDWSRMYVMEFEERPASRSIFVDQPHFDGQPLPSQYFGKSLDELLATSATPPDLSSLAASNYLTLNQSPELRRHPILDQFVSDMRRDPLALANYVLNEIELTDAMDYDTNFNNQAAINLGGVNRSALSTFQERQGSPMEQCALLVYLLRQAGVPATYVFPTNNGLKMLDAQLSKLLRFQVKGAVSQTGLTNLPTLIGVNYPWVAAYVGTNWVQIFPWLKDTSVIEGLDLYDYMGSSYNTGHKWLEQFAQNDTNIMSLSESDQPMDLFPKFIDQQLGLNASGISRDDIGVKIVNRRHLYSRWSDFPTPFQISGVPMVKESLASDLDLFNTIQIHVYSSANPSKAIDTGELRIADIHNRKLQLKFLQVGSQNVHDMVLSLDSYEPGITNSWPFNRNPDPALRLIQTNRLDSSDDSIKFQVIHKRVRTLPPNYSAASVSSNPWGYLYFEQGVEKRIGLVYEKTETFRKGDLVTFCLDVGRVSQQMLNTHAEAIWLHNRTATNSTLADPDVYQGTVAYLAGMSYWQYCDRFREINSRLHKVQTLANYSYGFSLLRPQRDTSGVLVSGGAVNLIEPVLHIPQNGEAVVFNGTLRPDSGRDVVAAHWDWLMLQAAQGSAAEHGVLRSFYGTNAVSTIKLLQLSGTNIANLNRRNYSAEGETVYNGKKLKEHDPAMWDRVVSHFNTGAYEDNYKQVLMTQGAITNDTFKGMGALLIGFQGFDAAISGLLNGGNADQLPASTLSQANGPNITVAPNPDGSVSPFSFVSTPISSGNQLISSDTTIWNQQLYLDALAAYHATLDPSLALASMQANLLNGAVNGSSVNGYQFMNDAGWAGVANWQGDRVNFVADPVNAVSGEFYIDAVDLSLPGPMPLEVRRNYGSHNLAENQFGVGWKMNYMPFLTVSTNGDLIYAAEPDGSVIAYERTGTNINVWLPNTARNPDLSNKGNDGIGATANRFNSRIDRAIVGGTNTYVLSTANGNIRTFAERSYPIGADFDRLRPYLTRWQDNRGNFYTFEYGQDSTKPDYGQVRRIQSSNGSFLGFYFDVYGHIIEAYTGDGRRLFYEYDKYGDLVRVTLPDTSEWSYEYQHSNFVTNGVTNVYSLHLIATENKPDGRILVNQYDDQRRVTNQLATVGVDLVPVRNATLVYANNFAFTNVATNLVTGFTLIKDVFNNTNRYEYTNNLITRIIDPLNQTNEQYWYADNAVAPGYSRSLWKTRDRRGLWTEFKYDSYGNITNTVTTGDLTGDGIATQTATNLVVYNAQNLPTEITDPAGNKIATVYHPQYTFLPEYVIRHAGSTPVSSNKLAYYNATNTFVSGGVTYTNSAFGLLQQEIRALGTSDAATNLWAHDGRGFIIQRVRFTGTTDPAVTNSFQYNDRGELIESADAAGRRSTYAFDAMGRPIHQEVFESGQTVPLSWESSYYNENGELTWSDGPRFDPEDYVWRDYDGGGRLTTQIRWRSQAKPDGSGVEAPAGYDLYATAFNYYDSFGNLTRAVDPRGAATTNRWDALGRLVQRLSLDLDGTTVLSSEGFAYEPGGKVRYHTNALGGVAEIQYTTAGKPKFQSNADGSTNAWRYYLDGRSRREIQGNGAYWETTFDDSLRRTTRVFYSATGTPLATNVTVQDRRGNVIQTVDAGGNTFTNLFDGLDRLKIAVGPPIVTVQEACGQVPGCGNYVTNVLQHATTNFYGVAGVAMTNVNALGEKTITLSDALGRVTRTEIRSAAGALVRESSTAYSPDHHGVTVTNGSGSSAIVSTAYTDNDGRTVLSIAYPSSGVREFTLNEYDLAGNLSSTEHDSATNTTVALWTTGSYTYDGLNRLKTKTDLDNALTSFAYNAAGNLTNRAMPGNLTWSATYNNAGQILTEKDSNGGQNTRNFVCSYYPAGDKWAGLLQTATDGRNVTRTNLYDDYLRVAAVNTTGALAEEKMTMSWGYDARGNWTNLTKAFATSITGPTISIRRDFDAYGQITSQSALFTTLPWTSVSQSWDAVGRRSVSGGQTFAYRADGLMTAVNSATFGYTSGGLLTGRTNGARAMAIEQRDGTGRPLQAATRVNLAAVLTENWTWTGDGMPGSYVAARGDFTDTRRFDYGELHRRLTQETLNVSASQSVTNNYTFDNDAAGGLGVLTKAGAPNSSSGSWSGGLDTFSRVIAGTNSTIHRSASGSVNGAAGLRAYLNGLPVDVRHDPRTASPWAVDMPLRAGTTNTLAVYADHPSGRFTTNKASTFTVSAGSSEREECQYDGEGFVTNRVWRNASGQVVKTQTLTWDAFGDLVSVKERNASNNGFNHTVVSDALGRPIYTVETWISNGAVVSSPAPVTALFTYDPEADFLIQQIRVRQGTVSRTDTLAYGPDLSGGYGGMHGIGGLETITSGSAGESFVTINDAFGNILGVVTNGTVAWNAARVNLYAAQEGYMPPRLSLNAPLYESLAWRTRPVTAAGFAQLGVRPYDLTRRAFLSADPLGHESDPALNTAFNGNPARFFDADGRAPYAFNPSDPSTWVVPKDGTWSGPKGNSLWYPQQGSDVYVRTGGRPIQWVRGTPNFRPYVESVSVGGVKLPGTVNVEYTGNASGDRALAVRALAEQSGVTQAGVNQALSENEIRIHHYYEGEMQMVPSELNEIPHAGMASGLRAGNVSLSEGIGMGAGKMLGVLGIIGLLTDPASAIGGPTTTMGDATLTGVFERARTAVANPYGVDTKQLQHAYDILQTGLTIGAMDDPANLQFYLGIMAQNNIQAGSVNAPQTITLSKH